MILFNYILGWIVGLTTGFAFGCWWERQRLRKKLKDLKPVLEQFEIKRPLCTDTLHLYWGTSLVCSCGQVNRLFDQFHIPKVQ